MMWLRGDGYNGFQPSGIALDVALYYRMRGSYYYGILQTLQNVYMYGNELQHRILID